jgi:hypothetical protein
MSSSSSSASPTDAEIIKVGTEGVQVLLKNIREDKNSEDKPWIKKLEKVVDQCPLVVHESEVPNSSLYRFKCVIDIPYHPDLVQRVMHDNVTRLKWDTNIDQLEVIDIQTATSDKPRVFLLRSATKAVGPISARDFVDVTAVLNDSNGKLISGGGSIVDLGRFPIQSGFVRGWNTSGGGWYYEPMEKDGKIIGCRVHYVIQTDLKGWLPTMIVNGAIAGSYVTFFTDFLKHLKVTYPSGKCN